MPWGVRALGLLARMLRGQLPLRFASHSTQTIGLLRDSPRILLTAPSIPGQRTGPLIPLLVLNRVLTNTNPSLVSCLSAGTQSANGKEWPRDGWHSGTSRAELAAIHQSCDALLGWTHGARNANRQPFKSGLVTCTYQRGQGGQHLTRACLIAVPNIEGGQLPRCLLATAMSSVPSRAVVMIIMIKAHASQT
jgi:hypothetical protein